MGEGGARPRSGWEDGGGRRQARMTSPARRVSEWRGCRLASPHPPTPSARAPPSPTSGEGSAPLSTAPLKSWMRALLRSDLLKDRPLGRPHRGAQSASLTKPETAAPISSMSFRAGWHSRNADQDLSAPLRSVDAIGGNPASKRQQNRRERNPCASTLGCLD